MSLGPMLLEINAAAVAIFQVLEEQTVERLSRRCGGCNNCPRSRGVGAGVKSWWQADVEHFQGDKHEKLEKSRKSPSSNSGIYSGKQWQVVLAGAVIARWWGTLQGFG